MNTNLPIVAEETSAGLLIQTATIEQASAYYAIGAQIDFQAIPAIKCDLQRLADLMPSLDLLGVVAPEAFSMLWLVRVAEDEFWLTSALDEEVASKFRVLAGMGEMCACVREFCTELIRYAETLEGLLSGAGYRYI